MKRAVVLISGGLDSATTAYVARSKGYELYALTINYGQRHDRELKSAKKIGEVLSVKEHLFFEVPLGNWGGSSLTDTEKEIPNEAVDGIPSTYVPARNLVFLSIAGSWAEVLSAKAIFIGATQVDYSGYPDCRDDFLSSFEDTMSLGTKAGREGNGTKVIAPLLDMDKATIIKTGLDLGVDYSLTWSCYQGGDAPCNTCDSCRHRAKGFAGAGVADPLLEV